MPRWYIAAANPVISDSNGNFGFYAAPGTYVLTFTGPNLTGYSQTVTLPCVPNSTCTGLGGVLGGSGTAAKLPKFTNATTIGDSGITDDGSTVTVAEALAANANASFKGPNPYVDVTRYGVRAMNPTSAPAVPGITATTTASSTSVTISSASTFVNGDGVVIFGAGAAHAMTTPGAPTVTPSVAAAGTGTSLVVNAPAGGATAYQYQIVAFDKNGGITAASAAGTTATGAAALGSQSVAITSFSRVKNTTTVTTTAAHGLSVGAMVYISGTSDSPNFGGWFLVDTVADTTHFTFANGMDTRTGGASSGTGGTAVWFNSNHVTWTAVTGARSYAIYGRVSGTMTLLGVSHPANVNLAGDQTDLSWDDFGSPMMDNFSGPYFLPTAPPVAATADSLITTISSGAGTTTLTLAASAGTSVSGATILFDNAPNILTAANTANSAGSAVYFSFPSTGTNTYVVNSYLTLPVATSIVQAGSLTLNDTVEIGNSTKWQGTPFPKNGGAVSFGNRANPAVFIARAQPGVWGNTFGGGSIYFRNLDFSGTASNNAALVVIDGPGSSPLKFEGVNFYTNGGATDYMSVLLLVRGLQNNPLFNLFFDDITFLSGPSQTNGASATPAFYCSACGQTGINQIHLNRRGIVFRLADSGMRVRTTALREQGGIMPVFALAHTGGAPGGSFYFNGVELDTMAHPLIANSMTQNQFIGDVTIFNTNDASADGTGGIAPLISGRPIANVFGIRILGQNIKTSEFKIGYASVPNFHPDAVNFTADNLGILSQRSPLRFPGPTGFNLYWDLPVPTSVTATVAAGGTIAVGTYFYAVTAVSVLGGESALSAATATACTTTTGNQTCNVSWTASAGAVFYNVYRSTSATSGFLRPPNSTHLTTTSFSDTGFTPSLSPPDTPGGGIIEAGFNESGAASIVAPSFKFANSGFAGTLQSGTLTASRTYTFPDATGTMSVTVASGTASLGTAAIPAGTCATAVSSANSNVLTTDAITWSFNAAPGTGWPSLTVQAYPTAGTVNFSVCNPSAASVTPAAATLNWRVIR